MKAMKTQGMEQKFRVLSTIPCPNPAVLFRNEIAERIRKLEEEAHNQMQRRLQASKALGLCASQNEFEGSYERVEFERLLLEAHHKHSAATQEIKRLKDQAALGLHNKKPGSRGTISISGISLPLKGMFLHGGYVVSDT